MSSKSPLTIALAGQALVTSLPSAAPDAEVATFLADCDAAFCNFEGVVQPETGGFPTRDKTIHASSPDVMGWLRGHGFSMLSLANNHAFDLGPAGISATRDAADAAGLIVAGTGIEDTCLGPVFQETENGRIALIAADAGPHPAIQYAHHDPVSGDRLGVAPYRLETQLALPAGDFERLSAIATAAGHSARIAARRDAGYPVATDDTALDFFGQAVTAGAAPELTYRVRADDGKAMAAAISEARLQADCVLVSLHQHHWGGDWSVAPAWVDAIGRDLVDAGADIVAVHGNPRFHGVTEYKGKLIARGLGNFAFQTRRAERYGDPAVWRSTILKVKVEGDAKVKVATELLISIPHGSEAGPLAVIGL